MNRAVILRTDILSFTWKVNMVSRATVNNCEELGVKGLTSGRQTGLN